MRKLLPVPLFVLLISFQSTAQCPGGRYHDFLFPDATVTSNVIYGSNISQSGTATNLAMDVYTPNGDGMTNRPLVIVCHGGYFLSGDKAGADVVPMCRDFARMGYVVASINYRVGVPLTPPLQTPYGQAVVRAVQDLRAAIRWFRKNAAEGGNTYNINSDMIFVGGDSAGGFMALHLAYLQEDEIPAWLDLSITGLEGGIEGQSGNPGYSSEVNAIFSVSGALGDDNWIDATDTTPACLFHGDNDATVTIDSGMFSLFGLLDVAVIYGSNPVSAKMTEFGIEHCYKINPGLGHVPYLGNPPVYTETISIISNFLSSYICNISLNCEATPISINDFQNDQSALTAYPNPVSDWVSIEGMNKNSTHCFILNSVGQIISSQSLVNTSRVDMRSFSAGIYFLRIEGNNSSSTIKVIVE